MLTIKTSKALIRTQLAQILGLNTQVHSFSPSFDTILISDYFVTTTDGDLNRKQLLISISEYCKIYNKFSIQ